MDRATHLPPAELPEAEPPAAKLPEPPSLSDLRETGPIALFLDFDGTLVDLAETPDGIVVPGDLAGRLSALAQSLEGALAIVTGRALVDLEKHLGPLAIACAGSHGIDRRVADGTILGAAPEVMPAAAEEALRRYAREQGVRLEIKPHGSALHYRSDPGGEEAGLVFAEKLAGEYGLSVKRGKLLIEIVHPGADKAGAVHAFMREAPFAGRRPVFVGDDLTDEDGMRAAKALGGFGILVGDRLPSVAQYRLASPAAVHDWLGF